MREKKLKDTNTESRDLELLSAYADGELEGKELIEVEQKLKISPVLQQELEKLQKLKSLTRTSAVLPPEDPYFESRLMARLNSESSTGAKLKKWFPAAAFGALAVFLMIFLKYNPGVIDEIVEEQKTNLAGFYSENLKPLLFAADLTNEDIFNFAFYNKLPLDNEEQKYLHLGYSNEGEEFFEINTSGFLPEEGSYENFAKAMKLNSAQKLEMDSILDSYKDELGAQLLVNDKNTLAINPNLWNYNKAIAADIIAWAKEINKDEFEKLIPVKLPLYNEKNVRTIVNEVKSIQPEEFIFVTPDSIFTEEYVFNKQLLRQQIQEMKDQMKSADDQLKKAQEELRHNLVVSLSNIPKIHKDTSFNRKFKVNVDSNNYRIELTRVKIPEIVLPDFDEIAANIETAAKYMQSINITVPKGVTREVRVKMDSLNSYNFNFSIPGLDSMAQYMPKRVDSLLQNYNFNGNFRIDIDSLVSGFDVNFSDSLHSLQNKEFRIQMKKLEEEMKQFRREMENLRKDLRKELRQDSVKVHTKKSIEI